MAPGGLLPLRPDPLSGHPIALKFRCSPVWPRLFCFSGKAPHLELPGSGMVQKESHRRGRLLTFDTSLRFTKALFQKALDREVSIVKN